MDNVSRRAFLKVPAAAATIAAPAILQSQSPASELRVAFVGVGNRGSYLLRHMLQVPGVKVVAVCDILEDRAKAAADQVSKAGGSAQTYTDYRKMLDSRKDIDAVVAATPDWTHKDVYISILEVGKHLYGEKPLALNAADGKMIVNAAKSARGLFQVGFQLRHDPARNAAENFIHSGGIGEVLMCHGIRHGGDLPRHIPWYFDKDKSGDMVVDQGIHILDLFTWAIGNHPERVMGSGGTDLFVNVPAGRTVMDNYNLIYEYPGGVRVNFSHHYFDPPGFTGVKERVFGSKGAIDLITGKWQPRESREMIQLDIPNQGKDSTYMAMEAFADSVRNRKKPINNIDSAYVSMIVPLMGTKAIYEKRIVTWVEMIA